MAQLCCMNFTEVVAIAQPVTISEEVLEQTSTEEIMKGLHIDDEGVLDQQQKEQLIYPLRRHLDIFYVGETDIECNIVKHRLDLLDEVPFVQRLRRIPHSSIEEVRQHIEYLLAGGIIRHSKSPWISNAALVRTKNGTLRLCVDCRMLNTRIVKDSYVLPRMEEILKPNTSPHVTTRHHNRHEIRILPCGNGGGS